VGAWQKESEGHPCANVQLLGPFLTLRGCHQCLELGMNLVSDKIICTGQ
jgi:hypothetical protein